jgi:hypothetical protein
MNVHPLVKPAIAAALGALAGPLLFGGLAGAVLLAALGGLGTWGVQHGMLGRIRSAWWSWRAREDRDIVNSPVLPQPAPAAKAAPAPQQQRQAPAAPGPRRVTPPPPPPGKRARGAGRAPAHGAGVPPIWAALADAIAGFEPENHVEHLDFFSGTVAGIACVADAFRAYADTQFHVLGLDPAAAQATLEMADSFAENSEAVALARQKFMVIYQEVLAAVENGLVLPHSGRWLTGEAA